MFACYVEHKSKGISITRFANSFYSTINCWRNNHPAKKNIIPKAGSMNGFLFNHILYTCKLCKQPGFLATV